LLRSGPVNIRFISTLTAEDENHLAPGVLKVVSALAEMFPIRFAVKLETVDGQIYNAATPIGSTHARSKTSVDAMSPSLPIES
jgi:hypothetical protein